jgi:hypothetical protein
MPYGPTEFLARRLSRLRAVLLEIFSALDPAAIIFNASRRPAHVSLRPCLNEVLEIAANVAAFTQIP